MVLLIVNANSSNACSTKEIFEIIQICAVTLSIIVGGIWAFIKFVIQRSFKTALDISVDVRYRLLNGNNYLASFNTSLKNIGQREITARSRKEKNNPEFVYIDQKDSIKHSCELQIKKIKSGISEINQHISWYNTANFEANTIIVNMIEEYEISKNGDVDFFMEPNEVYKLFQSIILGEGHYIGKIIFIGDRSNQEYWSQMFYFAIDHSNENESKRTS